MSKAANIAKLNDTELRLGIAGTDASWHHSHLSSCTVYIGGLSPSHTTHHILSIFEQYGTLTHVNLIRDPHTNQSKLFAFANYADPRSAVLAIDNLNAAHVDGVVLTVDHVDGYRMPNPPEAFDTTPTPTPMAADNVTHSGTPTDDSMVYPHQRHVNNQKQPQATAERKRQLAVMARLENLRKRRRRTDNSSIDLTTVHDKTQQQNNNNNLGSSSRIQDSTTTKRRGEDDEIAPQVVHPTSAQDQPHHSRNERSYDQQDIITPRDNPMDSDHSHRHPRPSMSAEEKRQYRLRKERRKAQRAAIRQARAERRANRQLQNR